MLFSQASVADFVNESFEPVWQSVRPVPIVRIDFGNGNVLTRTLHGNILTSICAPDGFVIDALPGIYTQKVYIERLRELRQAATDILAAPVGELDLMVRAYHRKQMEVKKKPANGQWSDLSKTLYIEAPIARIVNPANNQIAQAEPPPQVDNPAEWKALQEDTQINEGPRRRQIHELLANRGIVKPEAIARPIYKDVLHADLDDPYLGLGKTLFASYPFAKEDAAH